MAPQRRLGRARPGERRGADGDLPPGAARWGRLRHVHGMPLRGCDGLFRHGPGRDRPLPPGRCALRGLLVRAPAQAFPHRNGTSGRHAGG
eukprot:15126756-Alexandrium_andersonii.AAC.1